MKRFFCIFLVIFLLAGCGKKEENPAPTAVTAQEEAAAQKGEITVETSTENQPETDLKDYSGAKEGWGFRKIEGSAPQFTEKQIKNMNDFGCIYLGTEEKSIYLTFDEGYENGYTKPILDVLKKHSVPAAFFITGSYFEKNGDLVDNMVNDGHIVGNHTLNHPSLPEKTPEEIKNEVEGLNKKFFEKYGKNMKYLRPPMGEYSEKSLHITKEMGYTNVFWSFAYKDWETDNQKGKDYAFNEVKKYLHGGGVILLHAVSADNAAALEDIILYAREMGFEFKSLDEYK